MFLDNMQAFKVANIVLFSFSKRKETDYLESKRQKRVYFPVLGGAWRFSVRSGKAFLERAPERGMVGSPDGTVCFAL